MDPATGRSKGYGFVRFMSEQERDRALNEMNGVFVGSRWIWGGASRLEDRTSMYLFLLSFPPKIYALLPILFMGPSFNHTACRAIRVSHTL